MLAAQAVLPVAVVDSSPQAVELAEVLARAGFGVLELTLRSEAAIAAIEAIAANMPDLVVGAGTVLTANQAEASIRAGARFVVSPGLDVGVIDVCASHGVLVVPGVCTPTEVQHALRRGLQVLKFFPAEQMGGPETVRALSAPFSTASFLPTGGITPHNLNSYLGLRSVIACGMSWLADLALLRAGNFDELEQRAQTVHALVTTRS